MVERSQRLEGRHYGETLLSKEGNVAQMPGENPAFRVSQGSPQNRKTRVWHRPHSTRARRRGEVQPGGQPGPGACSSEALAQPPALWGGTEADPPLSCVAGSTFVPRCAFKFYVDPSLPLASALCCGPLWLPQGVQPDVGGRQVSPGDSEMCRGSDGKYLLFSATGQATPKPGGLSGRGLLLLSLLGSAGFSSAPRVVTRGH